MINKLIITLEKHVKEQERVYMHEKNELEIAKEELEKAIREESHKKELILAKNFVEVVDIIHKNGLRCVRMDDIDPLYDADAYRTTTFCVSDRCEHGAKITVQDGRVHGDRGEDFSQSRLDTLLRDLERFCERKYEEVRRSE